MCDPDKLLKRDSGERIAELFSANVRFEKRARDAEAAVKRLRAALKDSISENVWYSYYTGIVKYGRWWSGGRSDAEWLARELGLATGHYPVEEVTPKFPALVERLVKRAEEGQDDVSQVV